MAGRQKNAPRSGFFIGSGVRSPGTPAPSCISLSLLLVRRRKQLSKLYHGQPSAASAIATAGQFMRGVAHKSA